jgi:hypothetical protein
MKPERVCHPEIAETLHLTAVKEPELLCVLHKFFEYRTNPLSRSVRRFGDEKEGSYLDVQFKADGAIANIDGMLDKDRNIALSDHITLTLLENQKEAVGQSVCFSEHDAVRGFYRYKDVFQVLPIPAGAPHAPMIMAPHPFVLQFSYSSCPDKSINGYRRMERAAKLTRVLNTLCRNAISTQSRYMRHFWGFSKGNEPAIQLTQESYGCPGFVPELTDFSLTDGIPPIKLFPAVNYYDVDFFSGDYDQAFPDSIEQYLDQVFSLKSEEAEKFEIASAWFSQVKDLWPVSSSAALIAVVSAIEALLDKKYEICPECKQPKFGITKSFKAFLQKYVPDIEVNFPEEYKAIYRVRSDLAHGKDLLESDREYWNYFGKPLEQWQNDFQHNTHHITATALLHWVLNR